MMRTFIIGDIHGCAKELKILWSHVLEKSFFDIDIDRLIFLGDYIDRGASSCEVVDFCIQLQKVIKNTVFLKGNHEDMFLDFIGEAGQHGEYFIQNGGDTTLRSYSATYSIYDSKIKQKSDIPKTHIEFFKNLKNYHQDRKFIYVHAGVNPFHELSSQNTSNFFWQRDEFYDNIADNHHRFGDRTFIHGHTPVGVQFRLPYRINLDSACVFAPLSIHVDCALSCMELNELNPIDSVVYQVSYGSKELKILDNASKSWPS